MGYVASNTITITGVDGFVGKHLAREAKSRGFFVRGVSRSIELDQELVGVVDEYYSSDLTQHFPTTALSETVIHLAGIASVGASFHEPQRYIHSNSAMVTNLGESILRCPRNNLPRLIVVSTGTVYRPPIDSKPLTERSPISFSSPYVLSKVLVENQIEYYRERGISAVIVRPFNHIGPGQAPGFIIPDLWNRLSKLELGDALQVGNMRSERDYLDVRDVAKAYVELALSSEVRSGTYNISSGKAVSGEAILRTLCSEANMRLPELVIDPILIRPSDPVRIVGSSEKLRNAISWEPLISLQDSIQDFLAAIRVERH